MKKPPLLLTLGAAVVLIGGGAVAYWFLTRRGAMTADLPVGTDIVPQETLMTLSFSTDEEQWRSLRSFGTPATQATLDQRLANLRDQFLTANGLDYEEDIEPWVGQEVTVAFLRPAEAATASPPPEASPDEAAPEDDEVAPEDTEVPELATLEENQPVVMVLPIANPLRAQQILQNDENGLTKGWNEREYKGVQIREKQDADNRYSAAALGSDFVVISTDPTMTDRVIDTYKGQNSIADLPGYRDAFRRIQAGNTFAKLYVNVPIATELAADNAAQPLPPQGLASVQNNQGLAATLVLEPNGLRFQGMTWLKPDSDRRYEVTNTADDMPSRLPADTLLMVSGGNLQQLWQDYTQNATVQPLTPIHPDNLRSGIQATTGLDLDEDILSWMEGEFTLALIPLASPSTQDSQTPEAAGGVAPVFMVETNDRTRAEQTFAKLDAALSSRYRFQVQEAQLAGQPVVNWVSPFAALTVTRGWIDQSTAFLAFGQAAANQVLPTPGSTLAESQPFRTVAGAGSDPNNGHFFVNLDRLLNARNSIPLPALPPDGQEFANAIQAIGVTAAVQDARTIRYDIYVTLEKGDRPKALPSPTLESLPSAEPSPETAPDTPAEAE